MADAAPGVEIRRAGASDIADVRRILRETWHDAYAALIPEDDLASYFEDHYSPAALTELLRQPHACIFLASVGAAPVGVMITRFRPQEARFYVSSLYVLPDRQGRGIGSRLLALSAELAHAEGVEHIWLGVMAENRPARSWYERLGFTFIEELPFTMGKTSVSHLIGYLPLDQVPR